MNQRSIYWSFLLVLVCFVSSCTKRAEEITGQIRIASGRTKLVYYPVSVGIKRILSEHLPKVTVNIQKTHGSIENARLLRQKKVDLALMQGDIAYYLYKGEGPFQGRPFKKLRMLLPLHREYIHVIVSSRSKFRKIRDLKKARIAVGEKGSASYWNAIEVLKGAGLSKGEYTLLYLPFEKAIEKIIRKEGVDAVFLTAGAGVEKIDDIGKPNPGQKEGKIRLLSLEGVTLAKPYYEPRNFTQEEYSWLKKPVSTMAIPSVLVCRRDLDKSLGREIVSGLLQNWGFLTYSHPAAKDMPIPVTVEKFHIPLHRGGRIYFRESSWYLQNLVLGLIVTFLLLIAAKSFFFHTRLGKKTYFKLKRSLLERGFWSTWGWFLFWLAATWITGCAGIYYFERNVSPEYYGNFGRTLHTIVLILSSGLEGAYLPKTEGGWLFAVFTLIGWGIVGIIYGSIIGAIFVKHRMDLSRRKFDAIHEENHVVIVGWNENVPDVIAQIQASKSYKAPVILTTKILKEIPERLLKFKNVYLLYGDPYAYPPDEGDILERANIEEATCVLVVPEEGEMELSPPYDHQRPEENSGEEFEKAIDQNIQPLKEVKLFLRTLAVQKYLEAKKAFHVHVVAQCHLHETIPYLAELNVDEVIHIPVLSRRLLSQVAITPYVSRVHRQILALGQGTDLHRVEIHKNYHGKTFAEAYHRLFIRNIVLLGVIRKDPKKKSFPYEKLYEVISEQKVWERVEHGCHLIQKKSHYQGEEVDLLPLSGPIGTDKSSNLLKNYRFKTFSKNKDEALDVALVVMAKKKPSPRQIQVF